MSVCSKLFLSYVSAKDYLNWFTVMKVITEIKRWTSYWDTAQFL